MIVDEIYRADVKDAAEILSLQKLAYESEARLYNNWTIPPLVQTVEEITADFDSQTFLVLKHDEKIIGSVRAELKDGICEIGRLIVHPAHQRRGIGRALMKVIERIFSDAKKYQVFTGDKSVVNIIHYESHGYEITDRKPLTDDLTIVIMEKIV